MTSFFKKINPIKKNKINNLYFLKIRLEIYAKYDYECLKIHRASVLEKINITLKDIWKISRDRNYRYQYYDDAFEKYRRYIVNWLHIYFNVSHEKEYAKNEQTNLFNY